MDRNHTHLESPVEASKSSPPLEQLHSPPSSSAAKDSIARRIVWQLAGLLGASVVLGFAFNASSPVGVRFSELSSESEISPTAVTNQVSISPAIVPTNRTALLPPLLTPVEKPVVKPPIIPAPTPASVPSPAQVALPQTPAPAPVAIPQAPATPTPPAGLNPAPIHWVQAKPLVAAGQAVLVDVRAKGVYDAGHIPEAISLPETSSPEEFAAFLNQHPTNLTLIVYCSSTSCSQSARVAGRLVTQYQRPSVKYMTGGYLEYQQEQAKNPGGTTP